MRHSSLCVDAFSLAIDITPEVIDAGVHELREFNYEFDDERETVVRIWQAMWEARVSSLHRSD